MQNVWIKSQTGNNLANLVLGVFSPAKFDMKEFGGYDIKKMGDHVRFLEACVSRDGEQGGLLGLYFDGATCFFDELGNRSQEEKEKLYKYIESLR